MDSNECERIEQMARKAVENFLAGWQDTARAQVIEQDGEHILIVQPSDLIGMRGKAITLHLKLREFIEHDLYELFEEKEEDEEISASQWYHSRDELRHIAEVIPNFLTNCLLLLQIITLKQRLAANFGPLSQDLQEEVNSYAQEVIQVITQRWELASETKPGAPSVISDRAALDAILKIGEPAPSRYRLAKELNTTTATVRNWLRRKGFKSPDELVEDLAERARVRIEAKTENTGEDSIANSSRVESSS